MTKPMIDLPGLIAKSDDTDFLKELIEDAARRLMDILHFSQEHFSSSHFCQ